MPENSSGRHFHRCIHFDAAPSADAYLSVRSFGRQGNERYRRAHAHPEGQLILLSEGTCEIVCGSANFLVNAGQPCWVPPNAPHEINATRLIAGHSVLIAEGYCGLMPPEITLLHRSNLLAPLLERLANRGLQQQHACSLASALTEELFTLGTDRATLWMPRHARLRALATQTAARPEDNRSLAECARVVGMSPRTFSRHFSRETGLSFVRWRNRARMIKAEYLIRRGASATEAGLQVGYDNASAFAAAFRDWAGVPPSAFRKAPQSRG